MVVVVDQLLVFFDFFGGERIRIRGRYVLGESSLAGVGFGLIDVGVVGDGPEGGGERGESADDPDCGLGLIRWMNCIIKNSIMQLLERRAPPIFRKSLPS